MKTPRLITALSIAVLAMLILWPATAVNALTIMGSPARTIDLTVPRVSLDTEGTKHDFTLVKFVSANEPGYGLSSAYAYIKSPCHSLSDTNLYYLALQKKEASGAIIEVFAAPYIKQESRLTDDLPRKFVNFHFDDFRKAEDVSVLVLNIISGQTRAEKDQKALALATSIFAVADSAICLRLDEIIYISTDGGHKALTIPSTNSYVPEGGPTWTGSFWW